MDPEKTPMKKYGVWSLLILLLMGLYLAFPDRVNPYINKLANSSSKNHAWFEGVWIPSEGMTPWVQLSSGPKNTITGQFVEGNGKGYSRSLPMVRVEHQPPSMVLFCTSEAEGKVKSSDVTYYVLWKKDDQHLDLYRLKDPPGELHLYRPDNYDNPAVFYPSDLKAHEKIATLKKSNPE